MRPIFFTVVLAHFVLLFIACSTKGPTDPVVPGSTNSSQKTNTVSSTTNGNIVTNVVQVVTSSNISNYYYSLGWGGLGTADGQFKTAEDLAFDPRSEIYVCDWFNYRVQVFDTNGNFLRKWGSSGTGNGQFTTPQGIAISADGKVYVSDDRRVQVFTTNGLFITKWGSGGTGNGQFNSTTTGAGQIFIENINSIWVLDVGNGRIQNFDSNGTYLAQYSMSGYGGALDGTNIWLSKLSTVERRNTSGALLTTIGPNSYLDKALDVVIDSAQRIVVANYSTTPLMPITIFNTSGAFLFSFGVYGSNTNQLKRPTGIICDGLTNFYICDDHNDCISKYSWGTRTFYYTNYTTNVVTNL